MTAKKTQKHVAKTATPKAPKTEAIKVATTPKVETPKTPAPTTPKVKVAKQPKAKRPGCTMSGLDAAAKVLAESPTPLNAKQIVAEAASKGYWASAAATPHATIYASMLIECNKLGAASRFVRSGRGVWKRAGLAKVTEAAAGKAAAEVATTVVLPGKKA